MEFDGGFGFCQHALRLSLLRNDGEQIGVTNDHPRTSLFLQDGQRVAGALDGRSTFFGGDDDGEFRPEVGPLSQHLNLLNLAGRVEVERLEPCLARRKRALPRMGG